MVPTFIRPSQRVMLKTGWIAVAVAVIPLWQSDAIAADERQALHGPSQTSQAAGSMPRAGGRTDPVRDALERLSEGEIKAFYSRCSEEAAERRLDGAEAMSCSIGYDVLLKKHFANNFHSLLAWSKAQRERQIKSELTERSRIVR